MPSDPTLIEGGGAPERGRVGPEQTLIEGTVPPTPGASGVNLMAGGQYLDWQLVSALEVTSGEADLWLARDPSGRSVVLKLYRWKVHPKGEVVEKLSRVSREHVVEVYRRGVGPDGRHYEVLEYIQHGSLAELGRGGMGEAQVREVFEELAAAVEAVHAKNILHRDLKPSNVLVRTLKPLDLVLTDFGISSVADLTLHVTNVKRTAAYSAPEAITAVVGKASDWWSIGVMVLELLAGRHPYAGLDELAINFQLVTRGITVPAELPARWQMLLRGLLTRDHAKRWGASQVRQWLAGRKDIPVYYGAQPSVERVLEHRHRPYKFPGKDCYEAEELAVALAEKWDEGVKHFGRRMITDWVSSQLSDQELASVLMDIAEDEDLNPEQRLAVALVAMNGELPLTWRGEVVNREWLAANPVRAEEVINSKLPEYLARYRKDGWLEDVRRCRDRLLKEFEKYGVFVGVEAVINAAVAETGALHEAAVRAQRGYFSSENPKLSKLLTESKLTREEQAVLALAPPTLFVSRRTAAKECLEQFRRDLAKRRKTSLAGLENQRERIPQLAEGIVSRLTEIFGREPVPEDLLQGVEIATREARGRLDAEIGAGRAEEAERYVGIQERKSARDLGSFASVAELEAHRREVGLAFGLGQHLQKIFGEDPVPGNWLQRVEWAEVTAREVLERIGKEIAARRAAQAEECLARFESDCVCDVSRSSSFTGLEARRREVQGSLASLGQRLEEVFGKDPVPDSWLQRAEGMKVTAQEVLGRIDREITARRVGMAEAHVKEFENACRERVTPPTASALENRRGFIRASESALGRRLLEVFPGEPVPEALLQRVKVAAQSGVDLMSRVSARLANGERDELVLYGLAHIEDQGLPFDEAAAVRLVRANSQEAVRGLFGARLDLLRRAQGVPGSMINRHARWGSMARNSEWEYWDVVALVTFDPSVFRVEEASARCLPPARAEVLALGPPDSVGSENAQSSQVRDSQRAAAGGAEAQPVIGLATAPPSELLQRMAAQPSAGGGSSADAISGRTDDQNYTGNLERGSEFEFPEDSEKKAKVEATDAMPPFRAERGEAETGVSPQAGDLHRTVQNADAIARVVQNYAALLGPPYFFFKPNIPHKKLGKALKAYGGTDPSSAEDVLFLYDNTVFGGAKHGLMLTAEVLYAGDFGTKEQIRLGDVLTVQLQRRDLIVNGKRFLSLILGDQEERVAQMLQDVVEARKTGRTSRTPNVERVEARTDRSEPGGAGGRRVLADWPLRIEVEGLAYVEGQGLPFDGTKARECFRENKWQGIRREFDERLILLERAQGNPRTPISQNERWRAMRSDGPWGFWDAVALVAFAPSVFEAATQTENRIEPEPGAHGPAAVPGARQEELQGVLEAVKPVNDGAEGAGTGGAGRTGKTEAASGRLDAVLSRYEEKLRPPHFFFKPDIPAEKVQNALRSYGDGCGGHVSPEDVLFLYDDTMLGGGGKGLVLTAEAVYADDLHGIFGGVSYVSLKEMTSVDFVAWPEYTIRINGENFAIPKMGGPEEKALMAEMLREVASTNKPSR